MKGGILGGGLYIGWRALYGVEGGIWGRGRYMA